jgi:site-specific DNA recombinase
MINNFIPHPEYEKFRGKRGLKLTRVSTGSQSHEAQDLNIDEQIVKPLAILIDEERHVIRDTYTGLDYRYRETLDKILIMAEHGEFQVLLVQKIDRGLGRGTVGREVFLGQLWDLGINVLSTDPGDHVNDKTPMGMAFRMLHGVKDELEVKEFVERSKNGKRFKALGNPDKGIPPKVIGHGARPYGFKYVRDEDGKIETIEPNYDVVIVDSKGVEWTEVRVIVFIFRCAKRRITLRQIAIRLNDIGIPIPYVSIGVKYKSRSKKSENKVWQISTVSRQLRNTTYSGRMVVNSERCTKVPGKKSSRRVKTEPEEQIIVPVPALVSIEMQEACIQNLQKNQKFALRNNQQKVPALMRGGLARCGNCGRTVAPRRMNKNGKEYIYYRCAAHADSALYECAGCSINMEIVDTEVWRVALGIINDPYQVDKALEEQKKNDPTAGRRKQLEKKRDEAHKKQENLRNNLIKNSAEGNLDSDTVEAFNKSIREQKELEHKFNVQLADEEAMRNQWQKTQQELVRLHEKCNTMRKKIKDPTYEPTYKDKRDMIEYFGMTVILWEEGHINPKDRTSQRVQIEARFADIVLHPSAIAQREKSL